MIDLAARETVLLQLPRHLYAMVAARQPQAVGA
jgi:hypothetical protein